MSLKRCIERRERARGLTLRGENLVRADLSTLSADGLDLREALLQGATLRTARISGGRFEAAHFEEADWSSATLRMCTFDGGYGGSACFDGARLEDSTAVGADLSAASLRGTHLSETSFARALMRQAVLDNARGEGVQFRGADLTEATLIGARLDEADFRGADLRGADLSRGRFRCADFRGALLDGARFDRADCAGARFDDAARPGVQAARGPAARGAPPFDEAALNALRDVLKTLPDMLAAPQGSAADLMASLQQANEALSDAAQRPEDWKPWVDRVLTIVRERGPLDAHALLDACGDAPVNGSAAAVARLRDIFGALDAASGEPPEEWKPCLDGLMKMVNGERPFDPAAFIDALASMGTRASSQQS